MIFILAYLMKSSKKLLELSATVLQDNIFYKNQLNFYILVTHNLKFEWKNNAIQQRHWKLKYLGVTLSNNNQDPYIENYKTSLKVIKGNLDKK